MATLEWTGTAILGEVLESPYITGPFSGVILLPQVTNVTPIAGFYVHNGYSEALGLEEKLITVQSNAQASPGMYKYVADTAKYWFFMSKRYGRLTSLTVEMWRY